jgi:hypothetical protein
LAAEAPSSAPAPAPAEQEPDGAAVGRSLKTILGAVAAVLGVVASATALIFTLAPDLQPSPAPETQSAKLSELTLDEGATFGQYLARIDQPTDGYTKVFLQRRGTLLDFRVRLEGFKGRTLVLKWELFDRGSGDQVDESRAIQVEATNQTNEATWQFWIPMPRTGGPFFAIVDLLEQKANHQLKLATLRTDDLRRVG